MSEPTPGLSRAIAILTAWTETGGADPQTDLFIDEVLRNAEDSNMETMMGLVKLASILLVRTAKTTHVTEQEVLRSIATKYGD